MPVSDQPTVPDPIPATAAYVPELDGLRAIAISLVLAAHYKLVPFTPGGFGVTLFFFVSGYLITTLFFAERAQLGRIQIGHFYLRRWLRLTPPLLLFIAAATLLPMYSRTADGGTAVPPASIWAALLYYTNYFNLYVSVDDAFVIPFGICWSLAVEEHFYLLWPWVVRHFLPRPDRLLVLVVAVCAGVLAWRTVAHVALGVSSEYTYTATDCRIDSILYGAVLRISLQTDWSAAVLRVLRAPATIGLAAAVLLATFAIRSEVFRETIRYTLQGWALMPIFALALSERPNALRRVLSLPPMALLGKLSYTIYLFHMLARTPAEFYTHSIQGLVPVATGLGLTFLIALLMQAFVERPIARLRRKLHARPASSANAAIPMTASLTDARRDRFARAAGQAAQT